MNMLTYFIANLHVPSCFKQACETPEEMARKCVDFLEEIMSDKKDVKLFLTILKRSTCTNHEKLYRELYEKGNFILYIVDSFLD